jgi:glycosyltransferase involved in cell wall biosynthesis
MLVSVVIPTVEPVLEKNSCLTFTLQSLLSQQDARFEIIVVDQGISDRTAKLIDEIAPDVTYIRLRNDTGNPALARNEGAQHATGDLLLFLDDDTVLGRPNTLRQTVDAVRDAAFGCGAARRWTSVNWWKYLRADQPFAATLTTLTSISLLPCGVNQANGFRDLNEYTFIGSYGIIRRNVFEKIGGFDVGYKGWGYEDTDLMMRLCLGREEYTILGQNGVEVYHLTHPSRTRGALSTQERFNALERQHGRWFHVNHFFGVYEADGFGLFSDL